MAQAYPKIPIIGSASEQVEGVTHKVSSGDTVSVCNGAVHVQVLESPCHTKGHVMYYIENEAIFSGDTFFVGGCGRFFEGSAQEMWNNVQQMKNIPGNVKMFCGHEYTIQNFKFAQTVEPNNEVLSRKRQWAEEQRSKDLPTVPSTLQEEFSYNPFFRCDQKELQDKFETDDPVQVMKLLRQKKDNF